MSEPLLFSYTEYQWERPVTPLAWMDDAACAHIGTEQWFPAKGAPSRPAKKICAACPVREQCLAYALENNIHDGIYGGLSPVERRRLRKDAA